MLNQLVIAGEIIEIKDGSLTIRNNEDGETFRFNLTPNSFNKIQMSLTEGDIIAVKGRLHSNSRNEFSVSIDKMFGLTKDGLEKVKANNEHIR